MAYIKFHITTRHTDEEGYPTRCTISHLESDMVGTDMYDTNIIMHALSVRGKVELDSEKGFPYIFPLTFG